MADLRDHSEPCDHAPDGYKKVWGDGFHIGHEYQWAPAHSAWCPGGRKVTIDYEAATLRAAVWVAQVGSAHLPVGAVSDIVDAALPDGEV